MPKDSNIFIFGGTFDPVHQGHVGVMREVLAQTDTLVLAPTEQNPLKDSTATPLCNRIEMLELVLKAENIAFTKSFSEEGVFLSEKPYRYAKEFVDWFRGLSNRGLTWVVGPDLAKQIHTWKDWQSLAVEVYVARSYEQNLRSTEVRNARREIHPAIIDYVKQKGLYKNA